MLKHEGHDDVGNNLALVALLFNKYVLTSL